MTYTRITINPNQMGGVPCIRGLRMPLLAVQLVRVGEESGRLVEMLGRLADIYAQEVDTAVRRLTSMIEPVLILVIGVVVGGIVLSLLSAIAGLNALAL